ncbi:MAG: PEP-CTERM sorting domain-containing protein, partial [Verrucomicrobia bacterium]|nr:PEP-CTERM sorting domain-containing protein [Verrucomicrobiota bacterium]
VATGYGNTDRLFENVDGTLVSGGIVAMGYFGSNNPSGNIANIAATIADFTILSTGQLGSPSESLGGSYPGYVEATNINLGDLLAGDALIGKKLYAFVGNQSSLSPSTAFALYLVDTFVVEEAGFAQTYLAQPLTKTPLIGSVDSITANSPDSGNPETYSTIKLAAAVPEPSAALLGAIGALGLLRRRRN